MNSFGDQIRNKRESLEPQLRKVAAELDVDTSILSKIERGEKAANFEMIPILAQTLNLNFKELQIVFLSNRIFKEFSNGKRIIKAINQTVKLIKESEVWA